MAMICQTQITPTNEVKHFYGYDGHGNVRFLTDADGVITDRWDYDLPSPQGSGQTGAFGNLITRSGTTVNHLLYCGEYLDPDLGLYFLRARYMDTDRGRFWTMDSFEGARHDPLSLHKYLYVSGNPVSYVDPSGFILGVTAMLYGQKVHREISMDFMNFPGDIGAIPFAGRSVNTILGSSSMLGRFSFPDLVSYNPVTRVGQVYEIKAALSAPIAVPQLVWYIGLLTSLSPGTARAGSAWIPGASYIPPAFVPINALAIARVFPPVGGIIVYHVIDAKELMSLAAIQLWTVIKADLSTAVLLKFAGAPG